MYALSSRVRGFFLASALYFVSSSARWMRAVGALSAACQEL